MNFLKTIQNSIYSPQFYSTVLTKSFKSSLGYFLLLTLFLTIIRLITLIIPWLVDTKTPFSPEKFYEGTNWIPEDSVMYKRIAFGVHILIYIVRLIHLLLLASIIWLLSRIFKQNLAYGQSYKAGLYAITLGLIVELVVSLTSRWTHFSGFPFMVSILTLGVVLVNLILPKSRQNS